MTKRQTPSEQSTVKGHAESRQLLLIDDQAEKLKTMFEKLVPCGYQTSIEANPDKAFDSIRTNNPDVVLLDLHFPGDDLDAGGETTGGRLLGQIQCKFPQLPIVVFTNKLTDDRLPSEFLSQQRCYAKEKIKQLKNNGGDWAADLAATLRQAIEDIALKEQTPEELEAEMGFVVGTSPLMQKVVETIRSAAGTAMTVLVEGETGTGKELVTKALHKLSGRSSFTPVNCSGVHEATLESYLFGHEKGAFTDAKEMKKGLFERAAGGTVFLDEIQDMPASLQNKLIRVVQEKIIQRMGGTMDIPVDVRLIVATNRPAQELVTEGKLRHDLYYRLKRLAITLPPLRQRIEDIPLLWPALVEKANKAAGKTVMTIMRKEVRELLERHMWPGNIRELENIILSAVVNAKGNILLPQDIVFDSTSTDTTAETTTAARNTVAPTQPISGAEERVSSQDDCAFMDRLNQLSVEQRWETLMANTAGGSRKSVLIEIVRMLKANHLNRRVTAKELTEFLCGEEGESEKFKKSYDKVRSMLSSLDLQLTKLNCNQ